MQIWFTSDMHFGHTNIIKYCNRPFKSLKEMDKTIIRKFNERVKENDLVFFLGDFCFKRAPKETPDAPKEAFKYYRNQLNCKNIIFIRGNHDGARNGTKTIIESMVIKHGGKRIYLTHNPKYAKKEFELNFTGHVHEKWKIKRLTKNSVIINLSVDVWDFYPVNINEINQALSIWRRNE